MTVAVNKRKSVLKIINLTAYMKPIISILHHRERFCVCFNSLSMKVTETLPCFFLSFSLGHSTLISEINFLAKSERLHCFPDFRPTMIIPIIYININKNFYKLLSVHLFCYQPYNPKKVIKIFNE